MNGTPEKIARLFRHLSLRQRFLVAPLLGIVLLGILLFAFIYQAQRQNTLLADVTEQRLAVFDQYSEVFVGLFERHLALYELLTEAPRLDEAAVYVRAKSDLDAIHGAIARINGFFDGEGGRRPEGEAFPSRQRELLEFTEDYRRAVTHAVEMATVNPGLAASHITLANERFGILRRSFSSLLEMQRQELTREVADEIAQSRRNAAVFALAGLSGAGLLLYLSLVLSRILTHALERQLETLTQLGEESTAGGGGDEVQRIGRAIEYFKHTQSRLRANEARFRSFFEHNHAVMLLIDPESGAILAANQSALDFYGYPCGQLATMRISDINVLPAEQLAAERRAALREERRYFVFRHRLADGSLRDVEVHATPIETDNRPLLFSIIHDITERKRAETALRASQAALYDAQAVARVGSWTLDLQTDTLAWSVEAYRILGLSPNAPLSMGGFIDLVHPEDRDCVLHSWNAALGGQPYDIEHRILAGGEVRWVRECADIRFNDLGVAIFAIGTVQNITELKRAQEELRELNRELERRVAERTAELEAASRAKSDFLANMSHEIRTPMNTVLGMAHLVQKTELTPRQRDYVEKIHASGQHLLALIDAILDFSKIEAGRLGLEVTDFEFAQLMGRLASVCNEPAEAKGLRLVIDVEPAIPRRLRGDPLRLGQVLINYTNNAVKFTERGEITVRARLRETTADGCLLRFEVQDTGIGLVGHELDQLFREFQQADNSTTRKYGGTGLGLAICKQLATLMGGEVGADSQPGHGSTFWFTARLGLGQESAASEARPAPAAGAAERCRGARILLADDHPLNQQVACDLLEGIGAIVCVANNGREAVELLRHGRFDCVLMDLQMPEMDGIEATRRIRAEASIAALPVIAMTANAWNQDRERCLAAGMNDFISKPFQPEMLHATLARWLPGAARPSPAAPPTPTPEDAPGFSGDPAIIDLAVPARNLNHDPAKVRRVVRKFMEATRQDLPRIEAALAEADGAALGALGHRIKSPARTVGAAGLAALCQELEAFGADGDFAGASAAVGRLRGLFEQIARQVDNHPLLADKA